MHRKKKHKQRFLMALSQTRTPYSRYAWVSDAGQGGVLSRVYPLSETVPRQFARFAFDFR